MKPAPLAAEADPYLALNEKVEAVLSGMEELTDDMEKLEEKADFEPSLMRSILATLKGLKTALEEKSKPPTVTVQAPAVTIPAPNVTIRTDTPKKWRIEVTEREDGRIKAMTIEAAT